MDEIEHYNPRQVTNRTQCPLTYARPTRNPPADIDRLLELPSQLRREENYLEKLIEVILYYEWSHISKHNYDVIFEPNSLSVSMHFQLQQHG